jgi:RNA 2',3'-cyclic 3'-phosphodiesterase
VRLFVALVPPAEALEHLAADLVEARTRDADVLGDEALRWARPDTWHLTLAFLGEVADRLVPGLDRRLRRAAARHPACEVSLAGAGRFGGRVLWIGFGGEVAGLRRLAASVQAASRRAGADVDERPLRPHITLARARDPLDLRPAVAALAAYSGPRWTAAEIVLVRSRLGAGPGGTAMHEALSRHPLAGSRRS